MDGRGRAIDNIFIKRFKSSAKYEHIYLNPSEDGLTYYKGIFDYMYYYNQSRRHQILRYETPGNIYFKDIKSIACPRIYNFSIPYVETKRELVSTTLEY